MLWSVKHCLMEIKLWTHNKHPIAHPWGWAIGCLLWAFYEKTDHFIKAPFHSNHLFTFLWPTYGWQMKNLWWKCSFLEAHQADTYIMAYTAIWDTQGPLSIFRNMTLMINSKKQCWVSQSRDQETASISSKQFYSSQQKATIYFILCVI